MTEKRKVFLFSLLIVAMGLRIWRLGHQSIWMHEGFSIWASSHSISQIFSILETDAHPPLFYLFLHAWLSGGSGEAYLRVPFALIGVVNTYLAYCLGQRCLGSKMAAALGLFWGVSFAALFAETQVRMYAMAVCFSLLATLSFFDAARKPSRVSWLKYFIFAMLSVFTYYYCAFVMLTHGLLLVLEKRWKELFWIVVASLLLFFPWGKIFWSQFSIRSAPRPGIGPHELFVLSGLLGLYDFLRGYWQNVLASGLGLIGMIWGMLRMPAERKLENGVFSSKTLVACSFANCSQADSLSRSRHNRFLLLVIFSSLVVPFAISKLTHMQVFLYRYAIVFAPYFFLLFFHGLSKLPRAVFTAIFISLVAVNLSTWILFSVNPDGQRQNWRGASELLANRMSAGDAVVIEHFMSVFPLWYYVKNAFEVRYLPGKYMFQIVPESTQRISWIPVNGHTPTEALMNIQRKSKREWLVLAQETAEDPEEKISQWFFQNAHQRLYASFPGLDPEQKIRIFLFEPRMP